MNFSPDSTVTLVITSCGRLALLEKTLQSFDAFNTFPINKVIITEDSGDSAIHSIIPSHWKEYCEIIINNPKLGQIPSIDLAYSRVTTPYIFHCEDDWEFYRQYFIEDSLAILESNENILQVWLRSFYFDIRIHYPFISQTNHTQINNLGYYTVTSENEKQCGFGFNPGLRRLADYHLVSPYSQYDTHEDGAESYVSQLYKQQGKFAVILENDAVSHTGYGLHVANHEELKKLKRRKKLRIIRNILALTAGIVIGYFIA